MGKKHKHPEHENHERWVVSYADFMTLLFAVFTALFAMAKAELAAMSDVGAAISQGFNEQSLIHGVKSILQGQSGSDGMGKSSKTGDGVIGQYRNMTYKPGEEEVLEEVTETIKKVNEAIRTLFQGEEGEENGGKGANGSGGPEEEPGQGGPDKSNTPVPKTEPPPRAISVTVQERGVKISFDSRLLFQPGTANLKPESLAMVGRISQRLAPMAKTHLIHIEGHTDSQPMSSVKYPSNWELSAARASSVVRLLIGKYHFDSKNVAAVGYGASRPIATNKTADGRARNRRVDVVIMNKLQTRKGDPKKQRQSEKTIVDADKHTHSHSKPKAHMHVVDPKKGHHHSGSKKLKNPNEQLVHGEDQTTDGRIRVIYQDLK